MGIRSDFLAYPLLFTSYYKQTVWGGRRMGEVLHWDVPETCQPCGEAWEICDRPAVQSVVTNGVYAGKTLGELRMAAPGALVAPGFSGPSFPLLVKVIDAAVNLSVQVHPDAAACQKLGHGAEAKTEMWYILEAQEDAVVYAGLRPGVTREQFAAVNGGDGVVEMVSRFATRPGDVFFIPAGTVHTIGAGNLLLEIQQNSDTTYRIYDWGRMGIDGRPRELHCEAAMETIDFAGGSAICQPTESGPEICPTLADCEFFHCRRLNIRREFGDSTLRTRSFHLIRALDRA